MNMTDTEQGGAAHGSVAPAVPWIRRHRKLAILSGLTIAALVVAGTTGSVAYANQADHDAALSATASAFAAVDSANTKDAAATRHLRDAFNTAAAYSSGVAALAASAASYADEATLTALGKAQKTLSGQILADVPTGWKLDPAKTLAPVVSVPTVIYSGAGLAPETATTDTLWSLAAHAQAQVKAMTTRTKLYEGVAAELAKQPAAVEKLLVPVAASMPAVAATIVAATPSADKASMDALATALTTLAAAVKKGEPLAGPIAAYVTAAKAVQEANTAAIAAAAAAEAAKNATKSSGAPKGSIGTRGGASNGGWIGSSGSGGSTGGGGVTAPPAVIDHTPRVTANGAYTPGCDGGYAYQQTTSSGGGIIINVKYAYTYTTFSTADGWGLKVYVCI
jgi:uncharacterized membrane protein YgcG